MIFYFSATGNCKYVAERIAEATGNQIVSIAECCKTSVFSFDIHDGERIGFVTPVYHWGLPTIVVDFLSRLRLTVSGAPYIYHIVTYGTMTGKTHKMMEKALAAKELTLGGRFIVQMPDTWTPVFDLSDTDKVRNILKKSETDINTVLEHIKHTHVGDYDNKKVLLAGLYYNHYKNGGKTDKFTVDDACIGCELCARQCPSSAIGMQDKKPVWVKKRCTQCLGCLHRCPKFAIQYGKNTSKHGQYVNPYVKL